MKNLLLLLSTTISALLYSQAPAVPMALKNWEVNYGTQAMFQKNVTKTDGSGNVYTAGASLNTNGKYDILLTKVTSGGTVVYTKTVNGTANEHDFALGMLVSGTDVYITGAITNNTLTLAPEMFIAKYNSSGVEQFFTTFSNGYGDVGRDIVINTLYNYIIVVGASYDNTLQADMLAVVYDSGGMEQFNQTYDYNGLHDGAYKVTTRTNLFTITGPVTQSLNNYKLASQSYSIASGLPTGSLTVGATATSSVEIISDLVTDAAGNHYICGATQQNAGQGYDMYVAKVTSSLTVAWEQTINGFSGSSLNDFAKGIKVNSAGDVFVTGVTTHSTQGKNMTTVKINSSGVIQWTVNENGTFNGNDGGADLDIDASSNVYVTGFKTAGANNTDFYSVKYDASGAKIWEINEKHELNDEGTNIVLDNNNSLIIAGSHEFSTGNLEYLTYKYDQKNVLTPTDFNGEAPSNNLMYYANKGQLMGANDTLVPQIRFYTSQTNPGFYFKNRNQSFVFAKNDTASATPDTLHRIDLTFTNSIESSETYALDEQQNGYLNYFKPHLDTNGITGVKGNLRLVTPNLYSNIDLMCSSNAKGIKYYFIVKPGGDIRDIKMEFNGATSYSLDGTTNALSINSSIGSLTFKRPKVYQLTTGNATVAVTGWTPDWTVDGTSNKYKFNDGAYTSSLTLVIQVDQGNPATGAGSAAFNNLDYSTLRGGSGYDVFNDIDVAADGSRVAVGYTTDNSFPSFASLYLYAGFKDAVMVKYTGGDTLKFSTFIGGGGNDFANSVAINAAGEIFIGGMTASNDFKYKSLPGASNQVQNGRVGNPGLGYYEDGFIVKFPANGLSQIFGRYYGGSRNDAINSICLDASGNLHFTGYAFSTDIPMVNAAQQYQGTWIANNNCDVIVGKMGTGMAMIYSTYMGGTNGGAVTTITQDVANDITIDNNGQAIVVGWTDCIDLPVSNSTGTSSGSTFYKGGKSGPRDGFIARYSTSGAKQFVSYFGGNGIDEIRRVTFDPAKNVTYFAGESTDSTSFPFVTRSGSWNYRKKIARSAFIGMMEPNFTKDWCSFYGKNGSFYVNGLSTDNAGLFYLSGYTASDSLNYPVAQPTSTVYKDSLRENNSVDGYIAMFSPWQVLYHSHYLGGADVDNINNSDIGVNQKLYVVGNTKSLNFPIAYNANNVAFIDSTHNGLDDGFITRFDLATLTFVNVRNLEFNQGSLSVFPNPSNTYFNVNLSDEIKENTLLSVYTIMGQLIYQKEITSKDNVVHCAHWAEGVYIIKIANFDGSKTFKIVKQ